MITPFFIGFSLGVLAGIITFLITSTLLARFYPAALAPDDADYDPALDLCALAVEVLKLLNRPHWDNATVAHMAQWLQDHSYTPLSDPDEIAPVVQREC